MITSPEIRIHERCLVHVAKHIGSIGLSNVQQSPPQLDTSVYWTLDLRSDTNCWESWILLDQNSQVLVIDRIARDKDPWEAVSPCDETHREHWFVQCPTNDGHLVTWYEHLG